MRFRFTFGIVCYSDSNGVFCNVFWNQTVKLLIKLEIYYTFLIIYFRTYIEAGINTLFRT